MKTNTKTYILWGFFITMICLGITCNSVKSSSKSTDVKEPEAIEEVVEEVKAVVEEKIAVIEEKAEEVIEEKIEEVIEEIIPELPSILEIKELPIEPPTVTPKDIQGEATE